ncbi:hypothetical protein ACJJIQ_14595 [Microbulbifer sp. ANSA003]|uniref:hypothetical protein n=1 Tax=unclassified Microbulbifer TaxID=2619833 RepID=UPI00404119EC
MKIENQPIPFAAPPSKSTATETAKKEAPPFSTGRASDLKSLVTERIQGLQREGADIKRQREELIRIILNEEFSHRVPGGMLKTIIESALENAETNNAYKQKVEQLLNEINQQKC